MTARRGVLVGVAASLTVGASFMFAAYRLLDRAIEGAWR